MLYGVAAEFVLLLHAAFILFAVAGGLLVLRWRWLMWLHLPAAVLAPLSPLNRSQLREPLRIGKITCLFPIRLKHAQRFSNGP